MTSTLDQGTTPTENTVPDRRTGRWIEDWTPEDPQFWNAMGRPIARRNLTHSIGAELLGFCVWALWSVIVPQLPAAGFSLTLDEQFWLIAAPGLVGALLRVPYTFAVPIVGGRNWTVISALLLLLPIGSLAWVVGRPETSFPVLLLVAALAGFGGGNFASSMTNISFFYPEEEKGKALGLNAAGGNLGTGLVQLVVPAIITIGAGVHLERVALVFFPIVLLVALGAWRTGVRTDEELAVARRSAAGCIGIAGAVGALGGFFVPRGLGMSSTTFDSLVPAIAVFIAIYLVMAAFTWTTYLHSTSRFAGEGI